MPEPMSGLPLGGLTPYITSQNRLRTPKIQSRDVRGLLKIPQYGRKWLLRRPVGRKNPPSFTRLRDLCPAFVLETHFFCLLTTLGRPT